ncbi:MAG: alpha/beta fold hydrolase [Rubrivivax sp.]|nr:alpha/beta fold hydrolase [Rubrivivax sp.]MBK8527164.1 alpha/beta fold hydrolase [Rubrivivax sp.]
MNTVSPYAPRRHCTSHFEPIRGLRCHVRQWGDASLVRPDRPPLVLTHGWMDMGASFQFVVDALAQADGFERWVLAPDWRGFGLSAAPVADSYWFPDYLGDLDAVLDRLWPEGALDLVGHSMGGNLVMVYAGLRPQRIRRLVNLEGFGMPATRPAQAPQRLVQWLDQLKTPERLRPYADLAAVAARLMANDPLLTADKAAWLAPHWARPAASGGFELQADPAHKRINPVLYQVDEVLETWKHITAPLLWVDGDQTDTAKWWGHRYSRDEFHRRLGVVNRVEKLTLSPCGHMLHHDQPAALAQALARFLG